MSRPIHPKNLMPLAKPSPQPIQLIRLALIAGVLMFGAVTLFVHGQPSWKPGTLPTAAGYALAAYVIVAVVIARAMRGRVLSEADPQRRASLLIVGWALGEAAALFGGVVFFITGQGQWYLLGLLAMFTAFALLPVTPST
jgi:hypothetical protein